MRFPHVMVDLETFGSRPGSVIASIGAVAFDPLSGEMGPSFYRVIRPSSCVDAGLTMDVDTVVWWLKQGDQARQALTDGPRYELRDTVAYFTFFWEVVRGKTLWGHGAAFDEPILRTAFEAVGLKPPWHYADSRCTRTLYDLAGVKPEREVGVHHNALDDALAQAKAAIEAYRKLGLADAPLEVPAAVEGAPGELLLNEIRTLASEEAAPCG